MNHKTARESSEGSEGIDQRGAAHILGPNVWERCGAFFGEQGVKCYELSHLLTNTMPSSPFAEKIQFTGHPTSAVPGSRHVGNQETITGSMAQQGTHIDALGHFGVLPEIWPGFGPIPVDEAKYYGGLTQSEVKPTPAGLLAHLGIENVPPIISTAILLDAQKEFGGGAPLSAGFSIEAEHIETMLRAQGLLDRGILPGDVVYIHTGWGKGWADPVPDDASYYREGPGLGVSGVEYLASRSVVLVALDNPFTDPVNSGQLTGASPAPNGMPPGLPFGTHHGNLVEHGILQMQNVKLDELAQDRVWTSCTLILPLRLQGCSGSPVRPVAIGSPAQG